MEGRQRRSVTDDYKRQAVDLVASSGRPPDYSSDKPIAGGPSAISRLDRDVISLPGVAAAIWMEALTTSAPRIRPWRWWRTAMPRASHGCASASPA
jgi:hypothetical protein